jgi:hypothetical protein
MEHSAPRHATIVAVTSADDDSHAAVRKRAATIAGTAGSTVILWAADAKTSILESPLPTGWSGDGEEEQFGNRLAPDDLVAAGREPLASQVDELRRGGVDAWAWLPDPADAEHLAAYAAEQGASLVLVSAKDSDLIADLRDVVGRAQDQVPGAGQISVETVPA